MKNVRRKRILLVIRHPVGGIRTYIKYIYGQSVFDLFDFTVLTPDNNLDKFFNEIFMGRNLEYITFENNIDLLKNVYKYVSTNKVSLVHSHGFTAGSLSAVITSYTSIPHLMTAHEVFQKNQFVGYKGRIKKWLLSLLFMRIDFINTVSADSTVDLCSYFPRINKNNIRCIPHGIDAEKFFFADKAVLQASYARENICYIGFFGRFMAPKGFKYLVDAIEIITREKQTKKIPLVLTFDWGGFVREDYHDIECRGLDTYFHMMKFTDDMPGVIKAMDIVAMPSLSEASGLLGMEALVAGVPIIGSSCIGLREVLADSPAIMVPPKDSIALANAIVKEINSSTKEEFRRFSSIAKERFSIQRPAQQLKKLYDEIVIQ
jgi:glycosyltransferase involved in cell wall biosynthesis